MRNRIIVTAAVLCLLGAAYAYAEGPDGPVELTGLDKELDQISKRVWHDLAKLEAQCEQLLKDYTKPEEHGRIYFTLTEAYANVKLNRPPEKVIQWAKRGLEFPLDPVSKQKMYLWWADGVNQLHGYGDDKRDIKRREVAVPHLLGLKALVEHALPDQRPGLPMVDGGWRKLAEVGTPRYLELERQYHEQLEARKRAEFLGEMIFWRDWQTRAIVSSYTYPVLAGPAMMEELETLAREVLQDEKAIERLMTEMRARIVSQQESVSARAAATQPASAPAQDDHGVRVLLTAEKTEWKEGELHSRKPSFSVSLFNEGDDHLLIWPTQKVWGIEVDGKRYSYSSIGPIGTASVAFPPGGRADVPFAFDGYWSQRIPGGGGKPDLKPGKHTLRIICSVYSMDENGNPNLFTSRTEVVSNTVEFEITPAEKEAEK